MSYTNRKFTWDFDALKRYNRKYSQVYDVTAYNDGATFDSLEDLLSSESLDTLIPADYRKGGMSIQFVLSSDNKYVQYRLMSESFNTTVANWQGVDDIPIAGSNNMVKSGGVAEIQELTEVTLKEISPLMEDIYTSESDNYLDVKHVATGIYLDRFHQCTPTPNPKGVISRFIYLGNATQVTISGYVAEAHLQLLFLSQPKLDIAYKTNDFEATGTSRTVNVPSNSKYLVICLRHPGYLNDEYDYSNVKVSLSGIATTDIYQPKYLGRVGYEYLFDKQIVQKNEVAEIPLIQNELDGIDNVATKSISVSRNAQISQAASMLTLPVSIKKGDKYRACVRDTKGCVTTINAIYIVPKGSSDPVAFAANVSHNVMTAEMTANVEITAICLYCVAANVIDNGDIVLAVYNKTTEINNRVSVLEKTLSDYNKVYTTEISSSSSISQQQSMTAVDIKQGEEFSVEIVTDSGNITGVDAIYAVYHGSDSPQNLGIISPQVNTVYTFTATNDIDSICLYAGGSTISGSFVANLVVMGNGLIQRVDKLENTGEDTSFDNQTYKSVFKQVANDAFERFIPFTLTTPTNGVHQEDSDFMRNFNMAFFTDSHVDYKCPAENQQNVRDVVSFVNTCKSKIALNGSTPNRQLFDAAVHAGDIISGGVGMTKAQAMANAKIFFDETEKLNVPFVFAPGNHDRNDDGNPPSSAFTFADWAELYGNYAASHYGIVRGTKNGNPAPWCYRDFADKKIRIVSVFINDVDESKVDGNGNVLYNETHGWYIAQDQMDWLINTALDFSGKTDTDWGVIVLLHQSVQVLWNSKWYGCRVTPAFDSSIQKFFEVCKAFNSQGTYSDSYTFPTDAFYNLNINADFTGYATQKGWNSYAWNQASGANKGQAYPMFRKAGDTITIRMDVSSGTMQQYHLYVKYAGDADITHLQVCLPNQDVSVTLTRDIENLYIYVNSVEISGDVTSIFKTLQQKPHIICWLNGHEHWDGNKVVTGTDNNGVAQYGTIEDGGINIIWTAQNAAMMAYSDFSKPRLLGTATQNLFDLISIDTLRRKIRMVRVGAGVNCFGGGMPYGDRFLPEGLSY